jgi:hypothetical protein
MGVFFFSIGGEFGGYVSCCSGKYFCSFAFLLAMPRQQKLEGNACGHFALSLIDFAISRFAFAVMILL